MIIDKTYYASFGGDAIPDTEFKRLVDVASDIIYDVCRVKPSDTDQANDCSKKAVAYQVEYLREQGGIEAIVGRSELSMAGASESLGDYSISYGSGSAGSNPATLQGIPVSPLALAQLRRMGLMSRWAFARRC